VSQPTVNCVPDQAGASGGFGRVPKPSSPADHGREVAARGLGAEVSRRPMLLLSRPSQMSCRSRPVSRVSRLGIGATAARRTIGDQTVSPLERCRLTQHLVALCGQKKKAPELSSRGPNTKRRVSADEPWETDRRCLPGVPVGAMSLWSRLPRVFIRLLRRKNIDPGQHSDAMRKLLMAAAATSKERAALLLSGRAGGARPEAVDMVRTMPLDMRPCLQQHFRQRAVRQIHPALGAEGQAVGPTYSRRTDYCR
jgi:hypothetical protein